MKGLQALYSGRPLKVVSGAIKHNKRLHIGTGGVIKLDLLAYFVH